MSRFRVINDDIVGAKKPSRLAGGLRFRDSLRFRLTFSVVLTVLIVFSIGIFVDYQREYHQQLNALLASLEEQARALQVAHIRIASDEEYAKYVDDFCAQMNEYISPGHHILILDDKGNVLIRARHHSGVEVEQALLSGNPQKQILSLGNHKLAQIRLKDTDQNTVILAQYLDHMEQRLRTQLLHRGFIVGITALAIILLIYFVIYIWVIKPVNNLANTAHEWAVRHFATRSIAGGSQEFRFLSREFNAMAVQLERHERQRTAELDQAQRIQKNLLPVSPPAHTGLTIVAEYRPARQIAGDLYDIFNLPDGRTAIAILDVCGHGISAALLTGVVKMALHHRLIQNHDLSQAMGLVNNDLFACTPDGHFVTACVGIWNRADRTWTYCAAGHPGGSLISQGKNISLIATAPLLGVLKDADWTVNKVRLSPGDRIFLYTDGVLEAGTSNYKLGIIDLEKFLLSSINMELSKQVKSALAQMARKNSDILPDDATIVGFEVLSAPDS